MPSEAYVLTAAEAQTRARTAAIRLLRRGLTSGNRIALVAPDPRAAPGVAARTQAAVAVLAWGALRVGIVPVMVNPVLQERERADFIADSRVRLVLHDAEILALSESDLGPGQGSRGIAGPSSRGLELSEVPLGRPMHFTSGTTGRSKGVWAGVMGEVEARGYWADEQQQWGLDSADVLLNHGPLAHSAPLRFSMLALMSGATVVYTGGFDAERTSRAIVDYRPTMAMAVPTHLQRILDQPGGPPPSHYRRLVHAGSACPPDLKRGIHEWAGVDNVWEFLGSTEGQFTACSGSEWEDRPGTLGRARPGRSLLIDDSGTAAEGTIWCVGPEFARFEYFDDNDKTRLAWRSTPAGPAFTVGDLGRLDDDGYLFLHGRRHDLIISGGMNVYPAEVEAELRRCPGVRDVAVFGQPDPTWGERVCAAVVGDVVGEQVIAWTRTEVAGYRRPKRVYLVDELPLTSNGKVLREGLAAWVESHS